MIVYILEYIYNATTTQFNDLYVDDKRIEVFTKQNELWKAIESIQSKDSVYISYSDVKYYLIDLSKQNVVLV